MPTKKRTLGLLTPELTEAICGLVRGGRSASAAAVLLGHSPDLVSQWLARGEGRAKMKRTAKYEQFALAVRKAQEEDVGQKLGRINEAAAGGRLKMRRTVTTKLKDGSERVTVEEVYVDPDWKADAWLLEKTHKAEFGRNTDSAPSDGRPQVVVVLPDNGRSPGKSGSSRLPIARRKELTGGPAPQAPIEITGEKPIPDHIPTIHHKPDKVSDDSANKCPDCGHLWRLHRLEADGAGAVCCGGGCPCERTGE